MISPTTTTLGRAKMFSGLMGEESLALRDSETRLDLDDVGLTILLMADLGGQPQEIGLTAIRHLNPHQEDVADFSRVLSPGEALVTLVFEGRQIKGDSAGTRVRHEVPLDFEAFRTLIHRISGNSSRVAGPEVGRCLEVEGAKIAKQLPLDRVHACQFENARSFFIGALKRFTGENCQKTVLHGTTFWHEPNSNLEFKDLYLGNSRNEQGEFKDILRHPETVFVLEEPSQSITLEYPISLR